MESQPNIEIFADEKAVCGESPLWDIAEQRLVWVDNEHERFGIFTRGANDKATTVLNRETPLSALAFNDDSRLVEIRSGDSLLYSTPII